MLGDFSKNEEVGSCHFPSPPPALTQFPALVQGSGQILLKLCLRSAQLPGTPPLPRAGPDHRATLSHHTAPSCPPPASAALEGIQRRVTSPIHILLTLPPCSQDPSGHTSSEPGCLGRTLTTESKQRPQQAEGQCAVRKRDSQNTRV